MSKRKRARIMIALLMLTIILIAVFELIKFPNNVKSESETTSFLSKDKNMTHFNNEVNNTYPAENDTTKYRNTSKNTPKKKAW